jgi:hypothetical protein
MAQEATTSQQKAINRLEAIANALKGPDQVSTIAAEYGLPPAFVSKLKKALFTDPEIPRPEPTISLWQEPPNPVVGHIQTPTLPRTADYVVIGSGITGCSVTKALLENRKLVSDQGQPPRIVVVEARGLVSGATGRNGGQLVSPVGQSYTALVRRFGAENADEMTKFSLLNIETLLKTIDGLDEDLRSQCEIRRLDKVTVALDQESNEAMMSSVNAFRAAHSAHRKMHTSLTAKELQEVSDSMCTDEEAHPHGVLCG